MPNKYEKLTEPGRMINNIFANVNAGIEAGKKPADEAIEEFEAKFEKTRVKKKTSNKLLKAMLRDLKKEKVILKKSLSKAGVLIKELKRKLRRFDEIFNNFESKRKAEEVDAEFNEKEFNDYVNKKKGAK